MQLLLMVLFAATIPWLTPYPGSKQVGQTKVSDFDEYAMLVGPQGSAPLQLSGRVSSVNYLDPADRSGLEVFRNYQEALAKAGFKTLFTCKGYTQCGRQKPVKFLGYVPNGDDASYLAAQKDNVYVALHVDRHNAMIVSVESKGMQGGLVKVTAEQLAGDLKTQGHAALYGILFDTNKSDIKPESEPALTQVAALLQKNPSIKLYVVGHTDNVGTVGANVDLSKRRAGAVVDELVVNYHIVPARLQPEGVGPFAPVAPNTSEDGRAKNRRVELVAQ